MNRNLVTAAIMAVALGLLTCSALAVGVPALPLGPPQTDTSESCSGGLVVYRHDWVLPSGDQLVIYGRMLSPLVHGPALVRYLVPPGEGVTAGTDVLLTLPGREPESLRWADFAARYGRPCDLIRSGESPGKLEAT